MLINFPSCCTEIIEICSFSHLCTLLHTS